MNMNIKNKSLTAINNRAAEILGDAPAKRAEILQNIADAKAAKIAAEETKAKTLTEAEFTAAEKAITDAESRENFNRRLLDHMDTTPRMEEEDYNKAVTTCKNLVLTARDTARTRVKKAMQEIRDALQEYTDTAEDANETLEQLDAAANILQSKYGRDWRKNITRYDNGEANRLFTEQENPTDPSKVHLSVYCAAWIANAKAWPEQAF